LRGGFEQTVLPAFNQTARSLIAFMQSVYFKLM
jgi:hypothetical protein